MPKTGRVPIKKPEVKKKYPPTKNPLVSRYSAGGFLRAAVVFL